MGAMTDPGREPDATPYGQLTPERLLDALEAVGLRPDGRLLAMNSYENRVYQLWMDDGPPVVAKFYRPGRWSDAQILEEHAFAAELAAHELPVVAPLPLGDGTLLRHGDFRFAIYPRRGGRAPELDDPAVLRWLGRLLGRIHRVGAVSRFAHRETVSVALLGEASRQTLLEGGWIPDELLPAWRSIADRAIDGARAAFERAGSPALLRLHGDCHAGNILWTDEGPHFVDLDDARNGPAVQDLWMLLSGDAMAMATQMREVLAGYETFQPFDRRELLLLEALRTLRLLHYSAWIARRWADPAFPAAFPWFGTGRYWQDRVLELREQVAAMEEPALMPD
ncbi:MAG: serine/threonine protein kinase [Betaproteobacteria bacterium]|nr:serine/threonine protein kinase [Betaproteobacteria bacterium]